MNSKILLRLIGLLFLATLCSGGRRVSFTRVIKFDDFTECPNHGQNRITNVTVSLVGRGKYVVNLILKIVKTINGGKVWITMNKCRSSSGNECEHFLRYSVDYCNLLVEDGQPWTTFLKDAHPRLKCPLKPGEYRFINSSLKATEMMSIGSLVPNHWFEGYYWRVKFELIHNKKNLGCGICTLSYQRIRAH